VNSIKFALASVPVLRIAASLSAVSQEPVQHDGNTKQRERGMHQELVAK
jgi:hypothetical protein